MTDFSTDNTQHGLHLLVGHGARQHYLRRCRVTDPQYEMAVHHHDDDRLWQALGERLCQAKFGGIEWVDLLFSHAEPGFPTVGELNPDDLESRLPGTAQTRVRADSEFLEQQRNLFLRHVQAGRPGHEILLDDGLYLDALFRYCVAVELGRGDVAEKFEAAARELVCHRPQRAEILLPLMPKGVRALVVPDENSQK